MNNVIIPRTIQEKVLYNTVRIVGSAVSQEAKTVGTGCFFRIVSDNAEHNNIDVILTNKHVIENNKVLSFFFHEGKIDHDGNVLPTGMPLFIKINNYAKWWIPHPVESVDLGALLFEPIRKIITDTLKQVTFQQWLDKSFIRTDEELV